MPNYNQTLQTNNSSLEEIITQLNNMPDAGGGGTPVEQATPTITLNTTTGLITATATQAEGYVAAGTKSATYQLAFQAAQTITPGTTNKTIPANTYLGGVQTIKGDANLIASNIVSGKSIFGVVGTATAGGGDGDTSVEDGIISRTIGGIYGNDRVTKIGSYAFYSCSNLTSVSFPACTSIGAYAFGSCSKLTNANFPACTSIGAYAFYSCSNLTSVSFPACTSIANSAFGYCSKLTSVSFPVCKSIGNNAFSACNSLTSATFPVCTRIGAYAFTACGGLTSANFPACTSIGNNAFYACGGLTSVSFPVCTSIANSAFGYCSKLTSVSFPVCKSIGSYAFWYCSNLASIYLGASTVCALSNSNAFSGTSIWSTKGSIFVPASLLASYKAASHWSYFSNRMFSYAF